MAPVLQKCMKIIFPLMIIIIMIVPLIAVSFKLLTVHCTCLSYFKAGNTANSFTVYGGVHSQENVINFIQDASVSFLVQSVNMYTKH